MYKWLAIFFVLTIMVYIFYRLRHFSHSEEKKNDHNHKHHFTLKI